MHRSRHRAVIEPTGRRPALRRRWVLATVGAGASAAVVLAGVAVAGSERPARPAGCSHARAIQVVTAPEIAPAVSAALRAASAPMSEHGPCAAPVVRSVDPSDMLAELARDSADQPDVWIPDSSIWTTRPFAVGAGIPEANPSVASSPFVLAVPGTTRVRRSTMGTPLRVDDLLPRSGERAAPVRWALPDPTRSAPTVAAVVGMQAVFDGRAHEAESLAAVVRAADVTGHPNQQPLRDASRAHALPTTEQQVFAHNLAFPRQRLLPAYGASTTLAANYPFVVLAAERARREEAAGLLRALRGDTGRRALAARGFRDVAGAPGTLLASQPGFDTRSLGSRAPAGADVRSAVNSVRAIRRSSRILGVIDVSGSMAAQVPGASGASRLDLAVQGLVAGLATYQDDTVAGLWTFSTSMTPTTDYRRLVPLVPLDQGADGTSGRSRLVAGVARIKVRPRGGTALYDTVLAAVRTVRRGWDPHRANSVVVVTDGANADPDGVDLSTLLRRLRAERVAGRPVRVFPVAFGPSADLDALKAIARVTAGKAYSVQDPRQVGSVIEDAVGRRGCLRACG